MSNRSEIIKYLFFCIAAAACSLICVTPVTAQDGSIDFAALGRFSAELKRSDIVAAVTPETLAARLHNDPFAIFDFVRDQIAFQPYRGVLRGARGALAARAGNAWDQAVLLKAMLDAAGVRSSLLRLTIDEDLARRLVSAAAAPSPPMIDISAADAQRLGLSLESVQAREAEREKRLSELIAGVIAKAKADFAAISAAGAPPEPAVDLIDATRDYLWVQAEINGKPYDLQPAFPDGQQPVLLPEGVFRYVTTIPRELFHWVRLRLVLERWSAGGVERDVVLEKEVLPATTAGTVARVALQPRPAGSGRIALSPAVSIEDAVFSSAESEAAVPKDGLCDGAAIAVNLEIEILSPGEEPRMRTVTLADAGGNALTAADLSVTADVLLTCGPEAEGVVVGRLATTLSRLCSIAGSGGAASPAQLSGLAPGNPVLQQWNALLGPAFSSASEAGGCYLDAPAVATLVYRPGPGKGDVLVTFGGIIMLRARAVNAELGSAYAGVLVSRLFEAVARAHGLVSTLPAVAKAYLALTSVEEAGEFLKDLDGASRVAVEQELAAGQRIWAATGKEPLWWSVDSGEGALLLYREGGWLLPGIPRSGAQTPRDLVSGEVAALLGESKGTISSRLIESFIRRHVLTGVGPLDALLSARFGSRPKE